MTDQENALSSPVPVLDDARLDRLDLGMRGTETEPPLLPFIDVSLVTFNSQKWFPAFFASLAKQDFPLAKIHLYIIDHSPDDNCIIALNETLSPTLGRFASVHIERRENRGFGAGHNRTLALGQSAFVLVSNVDLTFEGTTLTTLVGEAVGAGHRVASWECRQKPYEHPKLYDIVTHETPWSSSACVLLRRESWQAVGGYDDHFFMYGEDVDLSYRLRDGGWKLVYCPHAVVWHHTYDNAGTVKETQYFGSTFANMLIRLRFGGPIAIVDGVLLQLSLLFHRQAFDDRLGKLWRNYGTLLRTAPHFLMSRRRSDALFPIRDWDYAARRDGAFHKHRHTEREQPLVSIVVRTYPGRLPLLREALQSLVGQTYRPIEIVVVEDGGNSAAEYVRAMRDCSNADIVYYSAPKKGRSHAGNIGLALSRGSLIGFLDDDDLLFADHVETMAESLLDHSGYKAAYSYAWEIETSHPETWVPYVESPPRRRLKHGFDRPMLWLQNYIPIQSILFHRELYETRGGFFEALDYLEDWDLWQRYALSGDFLCVEKTTSIYRTPADAEVRTRRMVALTGYYETVAARQFLMKREYSVGELRGYLEKRDSRLRLRLRRYLSRHPTLYRRTRRLIRTIYSLKALILDFAGSLKHRPASMVFIVLICIVALACMV